MICVRSEVAEVCVAGDPSRREKSVIFGDEPGEGAPGVERGGCRVMKARKGKVVASRTWDAAKQGQQ